MIATMNDFEVMAPVGSRESLAAALQTGADSIYFGIERLNMRAGSASAFTIDDLKDIAEQCRQQGVKSYLTLNTIIYDDDIALMHQIVDAARQAVPSVVGSSPIIHPPSASESILGRFSLWKRGGFWSSL